MNPDIVEFVQIWLAVNTATVLVLIVLSCISSIWILRWLESLDRWLDKSQKPGK